MNQPGSGRKWPVLALAALLAVLLLGGAIVVVRQQHSASLVRPGGSDNDFACGAVAAADDDSRPLQAHTDEPPEAWDADRPADPLPTREPIYIPAPTPDHRRSDSFERDPSDKPAFREVPPATDIAAGGGPAPRNPDREHAEVKGTDNLPKSLGWLAEHQAKDGSWRPHMFREDSKREDAGFTGNLHDWAGDTDAGAEAATTRATALALRAFVEAGYDHKAGDAKAQVRLSILHLRRIQNNDGSFTGAAGVRDHAVITMSLVCVYGLSGDAVLKPIVDKALEHLLKVRVRGSGWRDNAESSPDIVTTWFAARAIKEALISGLDVATDEVYRDVGDLLNSLAIGTVTMFSAMEHAETARRAMVAAAWVDLALITGFCGPDDVRITDRVAEIVTPGNLPRYQSGSVDYLYWVIGTSALGEASREQFILWKDALRPVLSESRRGLCAEDVNAGRASSADLAEYGSFDAVDTWIDGGRTEATALAGQAEALLNRYERMHTRFIGKGDSKQD